MSTTDNAFEVVDVAKYYGDVKALDGVSLQAKQGMVYGLLGPNGAGKTTLVRMLSTLLKPDRGTAKVLGLDVVREADAVRKVIGLAGQFAAVDELLSGYENLYMVGRLYHLSAKESRERSLKILEQLGLADASKRLVRTYSGGMRRRLDLGASLVGRPKILFLDEPTTGLDPRTRLDLWQTIRDLVQQGTSILLTTQYLEEADELANQIAVMDHGKLIAEGTSDQLKTRMGGDVVQFSMSDAGEVQKSLQALHGLTEKPPVVDQDNLLQVTVPVEHGPKDLMSVVNRLNAANLTPTSLSLHRPSLDDVFLALTGKKVEEVVPVAKHGRGGQHV